MEINLKFIRRIIMKRIIAGLGFAVACVAVGSLVGIGIKAGEKTGDEIFNLIKELKEKRSKNQES